jgi:hypothetical protein
LRCDAGRSTSKDYRLGRHDRRPRLITDAAGLVVGLRGAGRKIARTHLGPERRGQGQREQPLGRHKLVGWIMRLVDLVV